MKMERLQKIIARAGLASRRRAEEMILRGAVSVNGVTVTTLGTRADPQKDHIQVDGKRVSPATRKVYVLLNKPKGYITSRHDPQGRPTVMDLVADVQESIYPVGRLDFDSEGLLLLTNDGDLAGALMHPRSEVEKTYWVKVSGHLTEAQMQKIARGGLALPGARTAPCKIREIRTTEENSWVEVILHEGKNREIRRVMQKIGHPVNKLKRVAYAFLKVGDLPPGGFRYLTPGEAERLQGCVKRRPESAPESAMDAAPSPLPMPSKGAAGTPPRTPPRTPRRAPPTLRPPARQREDPRAARPFAAKPRRGASSFGASDPRRSAKGTRPATSPSSHPKKDARPPAHPRARQRGAAVGSSPHPSSPHPQRGARFRVQPRPKRGAPSTDAPHSGRDARPPKKNHGGGPQNRGPNKRAGGRPGGRPPRRRA